VDELRWTGPTDAFAVMAARLDKAIRVEKKGRTSG